MARLDKIDEQGTRGAKTDATAKPDQSASLPAFDQAAKERLAEAMSSMIEPTTVTVQGYDPHETIRAAAIKVAKAAVERIEKITATQIERWREQDPAAVAAKMPEFWTKQKARLEESLEPLDALDFGEAIPIIADSYLAAYAKLDNYAIFDHPKLDIEELVDAAIS
jgi:hypothetical protein